MSIAPLDRMNFAMVKICAHQTLQVLKLIVYGFKAIEIFYVNIHEL